MSRKRCFFDVTVDDILIGRVIFELYNDVCPKTCENFRALCTGEKDDSTILPKVLSYQGSSIHRVVKNFMIQGGDITENNGVGGHSIYGPTFSDENFYFQHTDPFLLSMANRGKHTNSSQFFITTQPSPHLDNLHVVFGRVLSGYSIVKQIENLAVDNMNRPLQPVRIAKSGELVKKAKSYEKAKKYKRRRARSSSSENSVETESEDGELKEHPLAVVTTIDPKEIPGIPSNKFLMRSGSRVYDEADSRKHTDDTAATNSISTRNYRYDSRGRSIKGHGTIRYNDHDRSLSVTPPHWKREQRRVVPMPNYKKRTSRGRYESGRRRYRSRSSSRHSRDRRRREDRRDKRVEYSRDRKYRNEDRYYRRNRSPERSSTKLVKNVFPKSGLNNELVKEFTQKYDLIQTNETASSDLKKSDEDFRGPVDLNALDYEMDVPPQQSSDKQNSIITNIIVEKKLVDTESKSDNIKTLQQFQSLYSKDPQNLNMFGSQDRKVTIFKSKENRYSLSDNDKTSKSSIQQMLKDNGHAEAGPGEIYCVIINQNDKLTNFRSRVYKIKRSQSRTRSPNKSCDEYNHQQITDSQRYSPTAGYDKESNNSRSDEIVRTSSSQQKQDSVKTESFHNTAKWKATRHVYYETISNSSYSKVERSRSKSLSKRRDSGVRKSRTREFVERDSKTERHYPPSHIKSGIKIRLGSHSTDLQSRVKRLNSSDYSRTTDTYTREKFVKTSHGFSEKSMSSHSRKRDRSYDYYN